MTMFVSGYSDAFYVVHPHAATDVWLFDELASTSSRQTSLSPILGDPELGRGRPASHGPDLQQHPRPSLHPRSAQRPTDLRRPCPQFRRGRSCHGTSRRYTAIAGMPRSSTRSPPPLPPPTRTSCEGAKCAADGDLAVTNAHSCSAACSLARGPHSAHRRQAPLTCGGGIYAGQCRRPGWSASPMNSAPPGTTNDMTLRRTSVR
jgi:hypothetical protein